MNARTAAAETTRTLAVWSFGSCEGCQPALLECERELADAVGGPLRIVHFRRSTGIVAPGPYDLSLVVGAIGTPWDLARIRAVRACSRILVGIGACGLPGGLRALRDAAAVAFTPAVYADPDYLGAAGVVTPLQQMVKVDYELRGCPIDAGQLFEVADAFLSGRVPSVPDEDVCARCQARGTTCVALTGGTPCLGPVTQAGCGALCPAFGRACVGCSGATRRTRMDAMARLLMADDAEPDELIRALTVDTLPRRGQPSSR